MEIASLPLAMTGELEPTEEGLSAQWDAIRSVREDP
jgi:hypothetical protein